MREFFRDVGGKNVFEQIMTIGLVEALALGDGGLESLGDALGGGAQGLHMNVHDVTSCSRRGPCLS